MKKLLIAIVIVLIGYSNTASADSNVNYIYEKNNELDYITLPNSGEFINYDYDRSGNLLSKSRLKNTAARNMIGHLLNERYLGDDLNSDGLSDDWLVSGGGGLSTSISSDSLYGGKSQRIQVSNDGHASFIRSLGAISANRYFIVLIDYKISSTNHVSIRINDKDSVWDINLGFQYFIADGQWHTAYVKFISTGKPITLLGAYADPGTHDIKLDGLRIYEITSVIYHKIGIDPNYISNDLFIKYPYSLFQNDVGSFETYTNGAPEGWSAMGNPGLNTSVSTDSQYGGKSLMLQSANIGYASLNRTLGEIGANRYFVALIDYKATSTNYVSFRINDTNEDWGINLGFQYFITDNQWHTAYIKFKSTGRPITIIGSYMDPGIYNVKLDGFRLYEISSSMYNEIGNDPANTDDIAIKYPFNDFIDAN